MLIDKTNKIAIPLVPKTGTHVIREVLKNHTLPYGWHGVYKNVFNDDKILYKEIIENYLKICVIRNPWAHAVSHYFHIIDNHRFHKERHKTPIEKYSSFENFLKNNLYRPQSFYTFNDPFFMSDLYIQSENLNEELIKICNLKGIEYKEPNIEKTNQTKLRSNYFNYEYPNNYRDMYVKDYMIEIVSSQSQNEINKFNYNF